MGKTITLEIPEELERDARAVAQTTGMRVEDVLTDWLSRVAAELPLDSPPDARILEICDMQMPLDQQAELTDLLAKNREDQITVHERQRLDELMHIYRHGLIRKAQAWQIAVQRGLKPRLN
jgi:antitoxin component of RelBE/YafQ-DinJ toxin-antitoxin module